MYYSLHQYTRFKIQHDDIPKPVIIQHTYIAIQTIWEQLKRLFLDLYKLLGMAGVYIPASQKNSPHPPLKFFPVFVDFLRSFKLHKGILTCVLSLFLFFIFPPFPDLFTSPPSNSFFQLGQKYISLLPYYNVILVYFG